MEKKAEAALTVFAIDLSQSLEVVKNGKLNKGRAALGAAKSLSFGQNVKSGSQKTFSKLIALDRRSTKLGIEKPKMILKGEQPSWFGNEKR